MSLQVDIKKKLKGFTLDVTFEADGDCMESWELPAAARV